MQFTVFKAEPKVLSVQNTAAQHCADKDEPLWCLLLVLWREISFLLVLFKLVKSDAVLKWIECMQTMFMEPSGIILYHQVMGYINDCSLPSGGNVPY